VQPSVPHLISGIGNSELFLQLLDALITVHSQLLKVHASILYLLQTLLQTLFLEEYRIQPLRCNVFSPLQSPNHSNTNT
jgi:hypothetical protein